MGFLETFKSLFGLDEPPSNTEQPFRCPECDEELDVEPHRDADSDRTVTCPHCGNTATHPHPTPRTGA